jgi:hypothetical protein
MALSRVVSLNKYLKALDGDSIILLFLAGSSLKHSARDLTSLPVMRQYRAQGGGDCIPLWNSAPWQNVKDSVVGWLVKSLLSYAGGDSIKMVPQPRNITPLGQSKLGPSRAQFSRLAEACISKPKLSTFCIPQSPSPILITSCIFSKRNSLHQRLEPKLPNGDSSGRNHQTPHHQTSNL